MGSWKVLAAPLAAALAACINVNLHFNFPQKELEQKLDEMEQKVREGSVPAEPKKDEKKAAMFDPQLMLMDGSEVQEKQPDVNVNTPAIRTINDQRATRFPQLKTHLTPGRLGEGNDARLSERDLTGLEGKAKADFKKLVAAENDDREALIREIARANNLEGDENLRRVRAAMAKTFKKRAETGWLIQTRAGEWRKKTAQDGEKLDKGEDIEK